MTRHDMIPSPLANGSPANSRVDVKKQLKYQDIHWTILTIVPQTSIRYLDEGEKIEKVVW